MGQISGLSQIVRIFPNYVRDPRSQDLWSVLAQVELQTSFNNAFNPEKKCSANFKAGVNAFRVYYQ